MKKVFWTDLWLVVCVLLGVLAGYTGGALGAMIGVVLVSCGLLVSMTRRVLAYVRRPSVHRDLTTATGASASGMAVTAPRPTPLTDTHGNAAAALRGVSDPGA